MEEKVKTGGNLILHDVAWFWFPHFALPKFNLEGILTFIIVSFAIR